MKKIVVILLLTLGHQIVYAQKTETVEDVEAWLSQETENAEATFAEDTTKYIQDRKAKLDKQIEKIGEKSDGQETEIKKKEAEATFAEDTTKYIQGRKAKLDKQIEKITKKADDLKAKIEKQDLTKETSSDTIKHTKEKTGKKNKNDKQDPATSNDHVEQTKSNNNVSADPKPNPFPAEVSKPSTSDPKIVGDGDVKAQCKNELLKLSGDDEIKNIQNFIHNYLIKFDDIREYKKVQPDLSEINQIFISRGFMISELQSFISDMKIVTDAEIVLSSPYDKAKRIKAQEDLKKIEFTSAKQSECPYVESIRNGIDLYYLATSNMLDLIQEIQTCYENYKSAKNVDEKTAASTELKSSIDFKARVENFRSVKYMSDMYDNIVNQVLCYDDNDNFVFEDFNMKALDDIKKNLDIMRNPQK